VNAHLEETHLTSVLEPITTMVSADTPVAELFAAAAYTQLPLPVVDDDKRLLGVIPRVTLLAALGSQTEPAAIDAPAVGNDKEPESV
jgi:glycine betaine/proline transport system ATP-binding protein